MFGAERFPSYPQRLTIEQFGLVESLSFEEHAGEFVHALRDGGMFRGQLLLTNFK